MSSGELIEKPVALLNAARQACHAYAFLTETLRTLRAVIVSEASLTIPLQDSQHTPAEMAASVEIATALHTVLAVLSRRHLLSRAEGEAD